MEGLEARHHETSLGAIRYWTAPGAAPSPQLVFLPGLTADHRLFGAQVAHFGGRLPILVWDPPGHAGSRPFDLRFTLDDKARWLGAMLDREGFDRPVLIGQSFGGYVAQAFCGLFPGRAKGVISLDSAPLGREYTTAIEIFLLRHMEGVYRLWPWKSLKKLGTKGVAETEEGRALMLGMMLSYEGDKAAYAALVGHGYRMLADAMSQDRKRDFNCPALLVCGSRDKAGSVLRYNRAWTRRTGIPLKLIEGAGHNANTDRPEEFNAILEEFLRSLQRA